MKFLLVVLLCSYMSIYSQAPTITWFRGQGTSTEEHVHEGMQTSDGGYIAIGHGIEREDSDDMLIVKVNANEEPQIFNGSKLLHWVQPYKGTRYSLVFFNNQKKK